MSTLRCYDNNAAQILLNSLFKLILEPDVYLLFETNRKNLTESCIWFYING